VHYTLQSGKDTTTCTFKCTGCGKRYSKERLIDKESLVTSRRLTAMSYKEIFISNMHITGCSLTCIAKASRDIIERVKNLQEYELLEDTLHNAGFSTRFLPSLIQECRGLLVIDVAQRQQENET
jgi:hypothetical protein